MPRILPTILAALLSCLLREAADAVEAVPRVNCEAPHQRELVLAPLGDGPLRLAAVYCQEGDATLKSVSATLVSPDAQSIAHYADNKTLRVARLDAGRTRTDYRVEMTFARFDWNIRSAPAISWSANGELVWAAEQQLERGGFVISALQPVKTAERGTIQSLPPLRHDAGPLDGLLWAGHDGLAVVQFGTRGEYYRPEHEDKDPLFAIVDAQRGLVRDTLKFSDIDILKNRKRSPPGVFVRDAVATKLQDGRVRALLSVGQWVVWTEGETPRVLPDPYIDEFNNRMAISPDGSRVLIGHLLRTKGGMCGRTGGCKPGQPVEGVLADLRDLGSGQMLWSIRATVVDDYEFPTPAISPDGRYALVGLVPQSNLRLIALIALDDGKIVQTLPAPGEDHTMGFARGGRTVWTHAYGLTALYDVRAGAP